jgi:chromosome segregation ATPase
MFASLARTTLSVLALFVISSGPAASPVCAQALPRPFVRQLIQIRTQQAFAVEAQIQKTQQFLAQVQATAPFAVPNVQAALSQEQAALAQIQSQISLLTQLLATEDQAFAVWDLIQKVQKQINGAQHPGKKRAEHEGKKRRSTANTAETAALQALLAALQAELAQLQAQINALQAQIVI